LQETWSDSSLDMYCEQVKRCTRIALKCLEKNKHQRPQIKDIIYQLDGMVNNVSAIYSSLLSQCFFWFSIIQQYGFFSQTHRSVMHYYINKKKV
jgi:hypothetical protein